MKYNTKGGCGSLSSIQPDSIQPVIIRFVCYLFTCASFCFFECFKAVSELSAIAWRLLIRSLVSFLSALEELGEELGLTMVADPETRKLL